MSFRNAFNGIRQLVQSQTNAKIHLFATLLVVIAGILFKVSRMEWCILTLTITMVWVTEGLNTAVECLCDRVTREHDHMIARVKDVAAGAVLIAAIASVVIAALVFLPYLLRI